MILISSSATHSEASTDHVTKAESALRKLVEVTSTSVPYRMEWVTGSFRRNADRGLRLAESGASPLLPSIGP